MDKVCVRVGKTGGNIAIDAPTTIKPVFIAVHSVNDSFSRDLDFFLIDEPAKYDYILCLVESSTNGSIFVHLRDLNDFCLFSAHISFLMTSI